MRRKLVEYDNSETRIAGGETLMGRVLRYLGKSSEEEKLYAITREEFLKAIQSFRGQSSGGIAPWFFDASHSNFCCPRRSAEVLNEPRSSTWRFRP
jgi:hypothetical protein